MRSVSKRKKKRKHPKWLKIVYKDDEEFAKPAEDDNPFNVKAKWTPPDGVVIQVALRFLAKLMKKNSREISNEIATISEAFGVPGGKRIPSEKQLKRIASQVFRILTSNNKRRMERMMHDLVFWPDFRGGFLHATTSPRY